MQRSFHCKLGNFLLLTLVASTLASQRLLVYRSYRAEIKTVTDKANNLEWQVNDGSDDLFAIQYLRESAAEVVVPNKISKLIVCDQPALNNRSIFSPHPLMVRKRPGVTLLVEMQLEKDEVTALRSITTLERSKLDVIRQRVAKVLKDNLDIDSISIDGISVEGAIDLSKLAVLSDAPLLLPPFYGFDLDADKAFNLERDISSLYLYVYLPNTHILLLKDAQSNTLMSLLDNAEIHEQCVILAKNRHITIESGAVKSKHVTLKVPANTEVHVIEDCKRGDLCTSRALSGATTNNSEPIRALTPVNMAMTRTLHKIGFHRDLETKIQLLNVKDFDVNPEHCSLVLVETLSEDYYIDRDEVEGLERLQRNNHFDFFTQGIDIERPAYTSTQHVVVVTSSHQISRDESAVYTITYPVHMRYQMPTPTDETHRKTYINAPLVYLKCRNDVSNDGSCNVPPRIDQKFSPLSTGVQSNSQTTCSEVTWVPVEVNHVIEPLIVLIPLGQLQHSWFGTLVTLGTTFLAVSLLAGFVYKTTSSKCLEKQKDD